MYPPVRALMISARAATSVRVSPLARKFWYAVEWRVASEKSHQLWYSYSP